LFGAVSDLPVTCSKGDANANIARVDWGIDILQECKVEATPMAIKNEKRINTIIPVEHTG
jgi:hypothetical protein